MRHLQNFVRGCVSLFTNRIVFNPKFHPPHPLCPETHVVQEVSTTLQSSSRMQTPELLSCIQKLHSWLQVQSSAQSPSRLKNKINKCKKYNRFPPFNLLFQCLCRDPPPCLHIHLLFHTGSCRKSFCCTVYPTIQYVQTVNSSLPPPALDSLLLLMYSLGNHCQILDSQQRPCRAGHQHSASRTDIPPCRCTTGDIAKGLAIRQTQHRELPCILLQHSSQWSLERMPMK